MTAKRRTAPERAADLIADHPWLELDWSSNGPYGAAQMLKDPRPCVICKQSARLLSPRKLVPTHKTCAEQYYLVKTLCGILRALSMSPTDPNER